MSTKTLEVIGRDKSFENVGQATRLTGYATLDRLSLQKGAKVQLASDAVYTVSQLLADGTVSLVVGGQGSGKLVLPSAITLWNVSIAIKENGVLGGVSALTLSVGSTLVLTGTGASQG